MTQKSFAESFDKAFPGTIVSQLTLAGIASGWQSGEDIKRFTTDRAKACIGELEGKKVAIKDHHERVYYDCPRCCEIIGHNACIDLAVALIKQYFL